jgi:hypothetical protein
MTSNLQREMTAYKVYVRRPRKHNCYVELALSDWPDVFIGLTYYTNYEVENAVRYSGVVRGDGTPAMGMAREIDGFVSGLKSTNILNGGAVVIFHPTLKTRNAGDVLETILNSSAPDEAAK